MMNLVEFVMSGHINNPNDPPLTGDRVGGDDLARRYGLQPFSVVSAA
jgi:hypothetical protein